MLELRPNCEYCDKDLQPDAADARICTYECTFCADCVDQVLHNVCPNCGAGFVPRPIRPKNQHRPGVSLDKQPASTNMRSLETVGSPRVAARAQIRRRASILTEEFETKRESTPAGNVAKT